MIPPFPQFRDLILEDRQELSEALAVAALGTSEMTFTNLYAWRGHYRPRLSRLGDTILVRVLIGGRDVFLPPVGASGILAAYETGLGLLLAEGQVPEFARVPQRHANLLLSAAGPYTVEADPDNFDYVYSQKDLSTLSGRKYVDKRNHLHYFEQQHAYDFVELTEALAPGCLALLDSWCTLRHCPDDLGLSHEETAIRETLCHLKDLSVTGAAILVSGKVEAFSLGEPLDAGTAVIHFEKGNPDLRGIYQVINRDFCRQTWAGFQFINREQDLGLAGLRKAKNSYNPVHLVAKYRIIGRL